VKGSGASVVVVSAELARAVDAAIRAAASTGGLVDPTVGAAVLSNGYDADFDRLEPDPRPAAAAPAGRWRELRLDGRLLGHPRGVVLDLNGVVKAQAVDDALPARGARLVSAGRAVAPTAPGPLPPPP